MGGQRLKVAGWRAAAAGCACGCGQNVQELRHGRGEGMAPGALCGGAMGVLCLQWPASLHMTAAGQQARHKGGRAPTIVPAQLAHWMTLRPAWPQRLRRTHMYTHTRTHAHTYSHTHTIGRHSTQRSTWGVSQAAPVFDTRLHLLGPLYSR